MQRALAGAVHIGCSGWHYKSWRGPIYPEVLPPREWLRAYARRFTTVEMNSTFYRLPAETSFAAWREQVPARFRFAMKASRFLTHIKRLRDPEEPLERLFTRAQPLGSTLKLVLYQLPPRWVPDRERLETFLAALQSRMGDQRSTPIGHVIEMRDLRGYEPWVLDSLRSHGVSLCIHDMPGLETPLVRVGPIAYLRLHGYGAKYGGSYPDAVLTRWAEWIREEHAAAREVYVYFNNDINGFAVRDAERLRALVGGERRARPHAAGKRVATQLTSVRREQTGEAR